MHGLVVPCGRAVYCSNVRLGVVVVLRRCGVLGMVVVVTQSRAIRSVLNVVIGVVN